MKVSGKVIIVRVAEKGTEKVTEKEGVNKYVIGG